MKTTSKYVGLDAHQASIAATVRDDTGRVIARSVLETNGSMLVEYLRGMRGAIHLAFEEGTAVAVVARSAGADGAGCARARHTPAETRGKPNVWGFAGLAVVTVSSADHKVVGGKLVRRKRAPMTRGLNRNHNGQEYQGRTFNCWNNDLICFT